MATAVIGDSTGFAELFARHRRELLAHAYDLVGSHHDAEDVTQETFLRAWRMRGTFAGRGPVRAWLYRIATNAALDALARRSRLRLAAGGDTAVLERPRGDEPTDPETEPEAALVHRETLELALLAALRLPPRQRAVLVARDVLDWPASDTAVALDSSVVAVNSSLQRARATLRTQLSTPRLEWARAPAADEVDRELVERYVDAALANDPEALAAVLGDRRGRD